MSLTNAQLQALKAHIEGDSTLNALPNSPDGNDAIAALMNVVAVPEYRGWRTSVPVSEIMLNGFDWTRVDNLSVGKSRIWEWMTQFGSIDPSQANIRAGINATWVGTQADLDVRAAVYLHCHRPLTRAEKLFAVATVGGSGTRGSAANPDTMVFEGNLIYQDVEAARNLS
jgi:hypothetical protein